MKIAISGKSGCGNSTVTRKVASRLGYRDINYTFKNIAEEEGMTFEQLSEEAEHDSKWDRHLDHEQVRRAREAGDAVLGSRLAIWKLTDADLKVYLDAPPEVRAERIQRRHVETNVKPTSYDAVLTQTLERDQRDHDRYLRLYGIDNDDYEFADLIIDAEALDADQIADLIVAATRKKRADQQADPSSDS